jgi:hypothetical protein
MALRHNFLLRQLIEVGRRRGQPVIEEIMAQSRASVFLTNSHRHGYRGRHAVLIGAELAEFLDRFRLRR